MTIIKKCIIFILFLIPFYLQAEFIQVNRNGYDNPNNYAIRKMQVFNGHLYAGAANWGTGSEIWRTADGHNWESITQATNGFGSESGRFRRQDQPGCNRLHDGRYFGIGEDDGGSALVDGCESVADVVYIAGIGLGEPERREYKPRRQLGRKAAKEFRHVLVDHGHPD